MRPRIFDGACCTADNTTHMKTIARATPLTIAILCAAFAAQAQHEHDAHPAAALTASRIGTADFQTSCKPAVKEDFNRGLSLLHSFWFVESRAAFEQVLRADPDCAIAYWGIALTHWGNPFAGLRLKQTIAIGKSTIDKARSTGTPTPRERAYIDAVAILFSDDDPATQRTRVVSYETAMEKLAAAHPDDVEAKIFWALSLAQAALPEDKSYARLLKAGAILEPLFERMPNHPGLAHYIIHAYDVPPLAAKALPAARAYADIAPAVPHALHMPSHTFTRVGLWRESVATNERSAATAERAKEPGAVLHALDYMTYAYLQMAMDSEAEATLERAARLSPPAGSSSAQAIFPNPFAAAAIPARYALERQQWRAAAELPVTLWTDAPQIEAMTRFARALGAARSGNPAAAIPEIEKLAALRDRALALKDAYWAEIIDIQRRGATAWLLLAQGKQDEAIATMRAAADAEDATDKAAVTPGPLAPAREMLGFMLLEIGNPEEALVAFDAAIAKEPNRFLALYGAGRAAEQAQRTDRAKRYFGQIVEICKDVRSQRPELAYARKMAS